MIYVVTDKGVLVGKTVKQINNKYQIGLEPSECVPFGPDLVIKTTQKDIEFLQDKARVSTIMFGNFFRKDNTGKLLAIVNLILTALILFTK